MQTVVSLLQGFHLNIFAVIGAAILLLFAVYLFSGKKAKKSEAKDFPSRSETYQFMYNQLLHNDSKAIK
ncbi:MAG TPA: hypothetical protein VNV85_05025 [Puia sp.]|jgi:hypothetical protein|nr:hypothetical protein [Puia sp.]